MDAGIGNLRAGLLALLLPAACDHLNESAAPDPSQTAINDISLYVTPSLRRSALDADGAFSFPEPSVVGGPSILTLPQAEVLVIAFVRQFARHMGSAFERFHGAPIDFDALEVGGRAFFVESAYGPLPSGTSMSLQKVAGPYYLFTLQQTARPTLSVAVSAYATDVSVENGELLFPRFYGNEFRMNGINATDGRGAMITPEEAVREASRLTGALASSLPTLRSRGIYWGPQLAYWEIELDRQVIARDHEGREHAMDRAYITHDGRMEVVRPNWDHTAVIDAPQVGDDGVDWSQNQTVQLKHRYGK